MDAFCVRDAAGSCLFLFCSISPQTENKRHGNQTDDKETQIWKQNVLNYKIGPKKTKEAVHDAEQEENVA